MNTLYTAITVKLYRTMIIRLFAIVIMSISLLTSMGYAQESVNRQDFVQIHMDAVPTMATYPITLLAGEQPIVLVMPFAISDATDQWFRHLDSHSLLMPIFTPRWLISEERKNPRYRPRKIITTWVSAGIECDDIDTNKICTISYY